MSILEEASKILGTYITPGKWKSAIARLDVSGGFTRKRQMELTVMILEHLEKLEGVSAVGFTTSEITNGVTATTSYGSTKPTESDPKKSV